MVMGESPALNPVMVCGTPSSVMRKFSFLRPNTRSPCCVAATASTVTMGASTEMVTPDSCFGGGGGGVWLAGAFCGAGAPPCAPAGACPRRLAAATMAIVASNIAASARLRTTLMRTLSHLFDTSSVTHANSIFTAWQQHYSSLDHIILTSVSDAAAKYAPAELVGTPRRAPATPSDRPKITR